MPSYPYRCQHLKINGTQCGSPALRRNRFCFFHKRFRDEQIRLAADRKRQTKATFVLPVLEDANSIQVALMQVMRLLISQQIEHKTASLLLYALQTASSNLRKADFNPRLHQVILDPRDAADSSFDLDLWEDDDFEDEEDDDEEAERDEIEVKADIEAEIARKQARKRLLAERKQQEQEAYMRDWVAKNPGWGLKRVNGVLKYIHPEDRKPARVGTDASVRPANPSEAKGSVAKPEAENRKPAVQSPKPAPESVALNSEINALVRKHFLPNMPEGVLPADWNPRKPAGSAKVNENRSAIVPRTKDETGTRKN
jgi:hypothetical protein